MSLGSRNGSFRGAGGPEAQTMSSALRSLFCSHIRHKSPAVAPYLIKPYHMEKSISDEQRTVPTETIVSGVVKASVNS